MTLMTSIIIIFVITYGFDDYNNDNCDYDDNDDTLCKDCGYVDSD
jgi:hypothetical protein